MASDGLELSSAIYRDQHQYNNQHHENKDTHKQVLSMYDFSQQLPIFSNLKESKTVAANKLLRNINSNTTLYVITVLTIKMQCLARRFLARRRVALVRHHVELFLSVTSDFASVALEEVVLGSALETVIGLIQHHSRRKRIQLLIDQSMAAIQLEVEEQVLAVMCREVVIETIKEAISVLESMR